MPRITATFSNPGSVPNEALWVEATKGVGIQETGLASTAIVGSDDGGNYLGSGLPVFAQGDLASDSGVIRVELSVDLPNPSNDGSKFLGSLVRVLMPVSSTLDPGSEVEGAGGYDPTVTFQYMTVDLRRDEDDTLTLSVYLTDPSLSLLGVEADHYLVASNNLGTVSGNCTGRFVVECGPRYVRAWWCTHASKAYPAFMRRTPDVGAYVPWIELERWGMCTERGKIRQVLLVRRVNDDDDQVFDVGYPRGLKIEAVTDDDIPATVLPAARERAVLLGYEVPHQTKRRRCAMMVTTAGPGTTGRLADTFSQRLDAAQTIIGVPDSEVHVISIASIADNLTGAGAGAAVVLIDSDPDAGPNAGIGCGRSTVEEGGEIFFVGPEAAQNSSFTHAQQDYVSSGGARESYSQTSNRNRRSWSLGVDMRPTKHLRRAEMAVAAGVMSRPIWIRPPLEARPIAAFVTSMSHSLTGDNNCAVKLSVEET